MRNPNRIDRILTKLKYEWLKAPDLRLGQLLVNLISIRREGIIAPEIFNFEDDELMELLDCGGLLSHYGPKNPMREEDQPSFTLMDHEGLDRERHNDLLEHIEDLRLAVKIADKAQYKKLNEVHSRVDRLVEKLARLESQLLASQRKEPVKAGVEGPECGIDKAFSMFDPHTNI